MGTHQETPTLKTLADAVTETAAAEKAKEGSVGPEGLDVNAAFDGGGAVLPTETVPHTDTGEVGPGGPDSDSSERKKIGASLGFEGGGGEGAKNCGHANGGESGLEQKGIGDLNGSLSSQTRMFDNYDEEERKMEDLCGDDGRESSMETDEGNEDSFEVEYMEDHRYSVGDLVWGKIKSHPWWPGQIYDPSDASESATKYNQKDRLLVAYFGDGSFAWCLPSQLIPFAHYFEDMSKQSTSKTFVNAVQEAVDEIGRLVELEMTCPCIPEANRNGLTRPHAMNAGIKGGVLVPDGEIGKLLSFRYDPVELLAAVANAAESVSFASMLDFSILKGWLSAFYRERGGYVRPVYCGPLQIEGLEDKNGNEAEDANDFSVPIEVPIHRPLEEYSFSPAASGHGNGLAPQEDKNHHRRKQKSVAELMAEGPGTKPTIMKRSGYGDGRNASNPATKKQKLIVEVENLSVNSVAAQGQKRGRKKKDDISQAGESAALDSLNGFQTEEEMQESKLGKEGITNPDTNDGEGVKEWPEEISSPRERKKSKYLSPPYTTPHVKAGNFSYKKEEFERERTEKKMNRSRIGERMTMAAGKVLESCSGMKKCDGDETVEKKLVEEETGAGDKPGCPTSRKKAVVGAIDVNCSVDQLLSGVQSLAVNPELLWGGSLDLISGFFMSFRKSMYTEEGESCKDDDDDGNIKKKGLGGKKKSLNSEAEKLVNGKSPVAAGTGDKKSAAGAPKGRGKGNSKSSSIQEKSIGKNKELHKEADERSSSEAMAAAAPAPTPTPTPAAAAAAAAAAPAPPAAGGGEISDLGSASEALRAMALMLEKCDAKKISNEAISKLNDDIKLLFEKIKKTDEIVEDSSN